MKTLISTTAHNIEMSQNIAKEMAKILETTPDFSVSLEGGLGAGKTFFVREIIKNLGVQCTIASPTYTYVNEYHTNKRAFAHFDFYRLKEPNEFFAKGFNEIAEDATVSCFSEWINKISPEAQSCFSGKKYVIRIEFGVGVGMRKVKLLEV